MRAAVKEKDRKLLTVVRAPATSPSRTSTIGHRGDHLPVPVEVRSHVGATLAAGLTHKPRPKIGQPGVVPTLPRIQSCGPRNAPRLPDDFVVDIRSTGGDQD